MSVFGLRLKEARLRVGLSQEQVSIEAGLDPMSASARMNRYGLGRRTPNPQLVGRIAAVLKLPAAYFYAVDNDEALLLAPHHALGKSKKQRALEFWLQLGS
jgi:transcriptional regulator with XRE-family HTH domain